MNAELLTFHKWRKNVHAELLSPQRGKNRYLKTHPYVLFGSLKVNAGNILNNNYT